MEHGGSCKQCQPGRGGRARPDDPRRFRRGRRGPVAGGAGAEDRAAQEHYPAAGRLAAALRLSAAQRGRPLSARPQPVAAGQPLSPRLRSRRADPAGAAPAGRSDPGDGFVLRQGRRRARLPLPAELAAADPPPSRRGRPAAARPRRRRPRADGVQRCGRAAARRDAGPRPLCFPGRARPDDRGHRNDDRDSARVGDAPVGHAVVVSDPAVRQGDLNAVVEDPDPVVG